MIDIVKVEDGIIQRVKSGISGLRTAETLEEELSVEMLPRFLLLAPFVLVQYSFGQAVEDQRLENFAAGVINEEFDFLIGAQSLRSRQEGRASAYEIMQKLNTLFDGVTFDIDGGKLTMGFVRRQFLFRQGGLVVYQTTYGL